MAAHERPELEFFWSQPDDIDIAPADTMSVEELSAVCDGYIQALSDRSLGQEGMDSAAAKYTAAIQNNPTAATELTRIKQQEFLDQRQRAACAGLAGRISAQA